MPPRPEVQLVWDTLSADIRRHEESHVIIARNHARLLEQALLAIPRQPDCEAALAKAAIVTEKVLDRLNAAQAEFDRVEAINFDSRMRRLLQYRMERLARAKAGLSTARPTSAGREDLAWRVLEC